MKYLPVDSEVSSFYLVFLRFQNYRIQTLSQDRYEKTRNPMANVSQSGFHRIKMPSYIFLLNNNHPPLIFLPSHYYKNPHILPEVGKGNGSSIIIPRNQEPEDIVYQNVLKL